MRNLGLGLLTLLILTTCVSTTSAEDFPICSAATKQPGFMQQLLRRIREFGPYGPSLDTAGPNNTPIPLPPLRPIDAPCQDRENRIGYFGYNHCELHPYYQKVFPEAGCNCYTGQCRPTMWRSAPVSKENPGGIEIYVNGGWYAVPPEVLHKFYANGPRKMPEQLLQYDAHVCADDPYEHLNPQTNTQMVYPDIECAWVKEPGT